MAQPLLTACDIRSTKDLFTKIKSDAEKITAKVRQVKTKIQSDGSGKEHGISFLNTKNQLLGQYNLDIMNLVAQKVAGNSIENNPSIERLIQTRTYIEKIRPIERKLKYQIEKLVKIATSGGLSKDDPLHLRPNPANMVSKVQEEGDDIDGDDSSEAEGDDEVKSQKKSTEIYKPPMMSAAFYEEEVTKKEREEAMLLKAKRRAVSTAIMRELRAEYSEAPEEVRDDLNLHRFKQSNEEKHRTDYEEDNYKRLALSKADKKRQRQMATMSSLDQITKFGDISALTSGALPDSKKKRKSVSKKGSKKKRRIRM